MRLPSEIDESKFTRIDNDTFQVEVRFDAKESDTEILPRLLKSIKENIYRQFSIPPEQLKYSRLLDKKVTPDGVRVTLEIIRSSEQQGQPILKLCSATLPNGQIIDNMLLLLDIFPLNDENKPISKEEILRLLEENKVRMDLVEQEELDKALKMVLTTNTPLEEVLVAKGKLPEVGEDAKMEYRISLRPDAKTVGDPLSARKAKFGDVLCVKKPRTSGQKAGMNIFGEEIAPLKGRDFVLKAGRGCRLSDDGLRIFAETEGVVILHREETRISSMGPCEDYQSEIQLRIDPLVIVEASRTVEIITKDSVEVKGNLEPNSSIISNGEVFVQGNVGPDSKIQAVDDIIVRGNVNQGSLVSGKNVLTGGNVYHSTINAKGVVKIEGLARNATISGDDIDIDRISGATVIAGRRIVVRTVEKDEADIITELKVGFKVFHQLKIDETAELIDYLNDKLCKLKDIFGEDIVNEITYTNSEIMFLRFALRASKDPRYKTLALETFKQLLDFIPSSKSLIIEKNKEIEKLKSTMQGNGKVPGQVIIKEIIKAPVRIQIDSVDTELPPGEGGVFTLQGDKIVRCD
jgi:uncharacterized protein (DUF342 family)